MTSRIALAAVASIALLLSGSAQTAHASVGQGDAALDAWTMTGELLVQADQATAEDQGDYPCGMFFSLIQDYNEATPWEDESDPYDYLFISLPNISWGEIESLHHYALEHWTAFQLNAWSDTKINFCMDVHTDGWLAADESIVGMAEDPHRLIQVTVSGEMECDYGEVLVVQSTYWFYGSWQWSRGTNWVENPTGGVLVSGDLNFECLEIFDAETDVAKINEAVPTTQSNANPVFEGLTGIDTWLWYDFAQITSRELGPYTESISSRGQTWTLVTYAWVDKVMWDVDCVEACTFRGMLSAVDQSKYDYVLDLGDTALSPASSYDGGAGTEADAAAFHMYETKGDYVISTATVWRGYYSFQGVLYRYDPVIVAQGRDYTVIEIRGVPTAGR
ncbi:MAG: hypothetical protein OEO77_03385 [Acidimicrobiia bacterium]|nr:hypothetical protein [Acidimicrobiia bacterium]